MLYSLYHISVLVGSLFGINSIYRCTTPTVKTDIFEALDHQTWRQYLLK